MNANPHTPGHIEPEQPNAAKLRMFHHMTKCANVIEAVAIHFGADPINEVDRHASTHSNGGIVYPRWIAINLYHPGIEHLPPDAVHVIQLSLNRRINVFRGGDPYTSKVEVERVDPARVDLLTLCGRVPPVPMYAGLIGLGAKSGRPIIIRLSHDDPGNPIANPFVCGEDKRRIILNFVVSMALSHNPDQLHMLLFGDPFFYIQGLPHVEYIKRGDALDRLRRIAQGADVPADGQKYVIAMGNHAALMQQPRIADALDTIASMPTIHQIAATDPEFVKVPGIWGKGMPDDQVPDLVAREVRTLRAGEFVCGHAYGIDRFEAAVIGPGQQKLLVERFNKPKA